MDFVRDCRPVIGSLNSQSLAGNREQIHSIAEGRNPFYILLCFFTTCRVQSVVAAVAAYSSTVIMYNKKESVIH